MRWLADVHVRLRPGIADPEGQTIAGGLHALGFTTVNEVRAGKLLRLVFDAEDHAAAEAAVDGMCRRLLANPVMETADWELRAEVDSKAGEIAGAPRPGSRWSSSREPGASATSSTLRASAAGRRPRCGTRR